VPPRFASFGYATIISRYSAFYVRRTRACSRARALRRHESSIGVIELSASGEYSCALHESRIRPSRETHRAASPCRLHPSPSPRSPSPSPSLSPELPAMPPRESIIRRSVLAGLPFFIVEASGLTRNRSLRRAKVGRRRLRALFWRLIVRRREGNAYI